MSRRLDWRPYNDDPIARATGISFNREPASELRAPASALRVYAWHIDHDERPVCFVDADTLARARAIADGVPGNCGYNVDYASVHDDRGQQVYSGRPW